MQTPASKVKQILESQIDQLLGLMGKEIGLETVDRLIVMGGDVRLALSVLGTGKEASGLIRLDLKELEEFVQEIWNCSPDGLVSRYRLSNADAESVAPALLAYVNIAKELRQDHLWVAKTNLRDGLMKEMAFGGEFSAAVSNQIVRSATTTAGRYQVDLSHSIHVANLCNRLFVELQPIHLLPGNKKLLLQVAAVLHEVGNFVSHRSYHKHSMYLIRNSEFFGLDAKNQNLVSLIARYHRRASPLPSHDGYASLNRKNRVTVARLAAILRVAKALDAARSQRISKFDIEIKKEQVVVTVKEVHDISVETLELKQSGGLFEDVFGRKLVVRATF